MPSKEYYEGRLMEGNVALHSSMMSFLNLTDIEVRGENNTKGDIVGKIGDREIPISIKHGSQKNTQVHLPTLRSFAHNMKMPENVYTLMEKWLGVSSRVTFDGWLNGKAPTRMQQKYKRLFAEDLDGWSNVVAWFNSNNRKIAELLIQSMNDENPAEYLIWVDKKKKTFQLIDVKKLINWIETSCVWVTGPRNGGSTLRCEHNGKPIFHLQMKGSGGTDGEYNHNPQFHIHTNWPDEAVVHHGSLA